jgi:hypothetical protein
MEEGNYPQAKQTAVSVALYILFFCPVGEGDHEVLGMGSFGEYNLYGN